MFNRLEPFLSKNEILTAAQNGFRKGKSIRKIQEALDKGFHTIGICIDFN
jgi:hypothetical protein